MKIPLSYLPCNGKIFLELVLDTPNKITKSTKVDYTRLSKTVEEYLSLKRVTM